MRALATALLGLVLPVSLHAQFFGPIEDLFQRVDGLALYGVAGALTSGEAVRTGDFLLFSGALRGMGVEVLIDLTPPADSAGADSAGTWGLELGLGADYLTGFEAEESTLDLRGSSRGLPILAAYATAPVSWNGLQPYLGLNTGFLQLWNAQGYDARGRQYGISAETFQIGASAGLYHDSGFFVEGSYRNRNFRSVEWGLPGGVEAVPEGWPRSLDLTAVLVSVGYQFGRLTEGG